MAMAQARRFLAAGRYDMAYSQARKAIQFRNTQAAWALRTKAACGSKDLQRAKAAFRNVRSPRLKRSVRRWCAAHGMGNL